MAQLRARAGTHTAPKRTPLTPPRGGIDEEAAQAASAALRCSTSDGAGARIAAHPDFATADLTSLRPASLGPAACTASASRGSRQLSSA